MDWKPEVTRAGSAPRERFIEEHLPLVRCVAARLQSRLPSSVELEDLVSDGVLGLLDAIDRYNPERGVAFRTYASARIQGSILDGLRRKDWRPRSVRASQRALDETLGRLKAALGRHPSEQEVADAMRISLDEYHELLIDLRTGPLLSLTELEEATLAPTRTAEARPDATFDRKDLLTTVSEEIRALPSREKLVLSLYYHDELTLREIGEVLGVTESRVCQLHGQAAARLRAALHRRATPRTPASLGADGGRS